MAESPDTTEECLPWQPIPTEFSNDWQVQVVFFGEVNDEDSYRRQCNLSIAIAAYSEPTNQQPRKNGAWRIDFTNCQAFRKRVIHYGETLRLTRLTSYGAFWEIARSRFMRECYSPGAYSGDTFHHFVIVSGTDDAYEIIAASWHCEPLPDEWAQPFSSTPMPRW